MIILLIFMKGLLFIAFFLTRGDLDMYVVVFVGVLLTIGMYDVVLMQYVHEE